MTVTKAYDQPLCVEICEGEIVIRARDGPLGISLTADAAAKTAEQLAAAASTVKAQTVKAQASQTDMTRD
jgi:hypothetical protein